MPASSTKSETKAASIKPISFGDRTGREPYNASEIVAVDDSRFLFCDNNVGDALFELQLSGDGQMAGPLVRRPFRGIEEGSVDDLEGMAFVRSGNHGFVFAVPSLSLKQRKRNRKKAHKRGKNCPARSCLLRISVGANDQLDAEIVTGFREWLVENCPTLAEWSRLLPDDGGLNIEGLAWSPTDNTLLLGLRTPVIDGKPLIVPIRIKNIDGPLELSNFELLPPVSLSLADTGEEQGIRTIDYSPARGEQLIVTGNSTSDSDAPFRLCVWDGNSQGMTRCLEAVRFHKRMKVEGVTHGTVGGRGAIVFVDDGGGYQLLWDDDPRLL
jgi:hypothetical protein